MKLAKDQKTLKDHSKEFVEVEVDKEILSREHLVVISQNIYLYLRKGLSFSAASSEIHFGVSLFGEINVFIHNIIGRKKSLLITLSKLLLRKSLLRRLTGV